MNKQLLLTSVVLVSLLSGCFIEGTEGGTITYDGDFNSSERRFIMNGDIRFAGTNPPQSSYQNITLKLYAGNGSLLYEEELGTLNGPSDTLSISVSRSTAPRYIIFDSPDIWDGKTGIDYYVRSQDAFQGYQRHTISNRRKLPITSDT